jgi:putative ABC transport system permease protein
LNSSQGLKMSMKSILSNKLRSLLTMLGIIIGVASVIALVSIGQGATKKVTEQIQSLGTNLLTVNIFGRGASSTLDYEQAASLTEIDGIDYLAPVSNQNAIVKYGGDSVNVSVTGTNADYGIVRDYQLSSGRFLAQIDLDFQQKVAVLGSNTVTELFGFANPVGEYVLINGTRFKVVGVLAKKGSTSTGTNDDIVLIPLTSAERLFQSKGVRTLYVQAVAEESMDAVVVQLESRLSKIFRGKTDSYNIFNQQDVLETAGSIANTLSVALGGIAGISLLVGGIGIMNIMLVSVTERTREIGIRKAIGAKKRDILIQFLIESMVLSGFGGLIGIAAGIGAALAASSSLDMDIVLSHQVLLLSFCISVTIGVLFGLFPANKAASLKPIEALRFE